jgi:hypothetical protein
MTAENLVKLLQMTGAALAIPAAAAQQPGPRGLMRHWGLNTKSVMPWELARHNRSSGSTRSHPNVGHETLSVPALF